MTTTHTRIGLSVREAGWLLQKTESQIRGMLHRGELSYVVAGRKIDPASVRASLSGAYGHLLLDVVLAGGFEVPRPDHRWGRPAPLYPGTLGLAIQTGVVVPEDEIEPLMDELARTRGPELLGWPAAVDVSERSVR
jgi:hypothetical protein